MFKLIVKLGCWLGMHDFIAEDSFVAMSGNTVYFKTCLICGKCKFYEW